MAKDRCVKSLLVLVDVLLLSLSPELSILRIQSELFGSKDVVRVNVDT